MHVCECVADWPAAGGPDRYLIFSAALRGPAAITILNLVLGMVLLWSSLPGVLLMIVAGLVGLVFASNFQDKSTTERKRLSELNTNYHSSVFD